MLKTVWKRAFILGRGVAIISLVMLLKAALDIGFIAPFEWMFDYYVRFVEFFLGWADPFIRIALKYIADSIGVHVQHYPHWKFIFVPMSLYFGSDVKAIWEDGRRFFALFMLAFGAAAACLAGIASATVPLDTPSMLPLVYSGIAFFIYSIVSSVWSGLVRNLSGYTRRQIFWYYVIANPVANVLILGSIFLIALNTNYFRFRGGSIAVLVFAVVLFALRSLAVSAVIATFGRAELGRGTWVQRFRSWPTQRHGMLVLQSIAIALLFIGINIAVQRYGP